MARRRAIKTPSIREQYPNHPRQHGKNAIRRRGGCKVSWETFESREDAEHVSKWAIVEASIKEQQGYDFGYCSPGSIEKVRNGFEVCLP